MTLFDPRTARILFTIMAFVVGLGLIYVLRQALLIFLFAIFFAYLMEPLVSRLQSLVRTRARAIAILYLLLMSTLVTFFSFVGPQIGRDAARLGAALPQIVDKVNNGQIAVQIAAERGWSFHTQQVAQRFLKDHQAQITDGMQRIGLRAAELAQNVTWLILIPILAIFMLHDGRGFAMNALRNIRQEPQRRLVEGVISDMNEMLAHFVRSQILLAILSLVVYTTGLTLMGMPYALVLGFAGGILEFIPVVGWITTAAAILVVATLVGAPPLYWLIPFLVVWRIIMDYILVPRILGHRLKLHPLALLFGILAGGEIAGVLGIFLSIPVMASLRIVLHRWHLYSNGKFAATMLFDQVMSRK